MNAEAIAMLHLRGTLEEFRAFRRGPRHRGKVFCLGLEGEEDDAKSKMSFMGYAQATKLRPHVGLGSEATGLAAFIAHRL